MNNQEKIDKGISRFIIIILHATHGRTEEKEKARVWTDEKGHETALEKIDQLKKNNEA